MGWDKKQAVEAGRNCKKFDPGASLPLVGSVEQRHVNCARWPAAVASWCDASITPGDFKEYKCSDYTL